MDMSYLFAHVFMYFSFKFVPFAQYDMYVAVVLFAVAVIVYCLVLPTTFYTKSRLALGASAAAAAAWWAAAACSCCR